MKSMELIELFLWYSNVCSMIVRRVKICSTQDRPLQPAHRPLRIMKFPLVGLLKVYQSQFERTRQSNFAGTDSSVMPHQLLHSPKSPFFGSLMTPLVSSGTRDVDQLAFRSHVRANSSWGPPCFNISGRASSKPGAFPLLRTQIIVLTSVTQICPISTGKSSMEGARSSSTWS